MVTIKDARTTDQLQSVASLMRTFSEWAIATFHANDDLPPNVFEKLEAELANLPGRFEPPQGALFVAEHDGQIVGCLGGAPLDNRRIEASRLWVDPAARGKNAGGLLIEQLIAHAKTRGFEVIVLRSHEGMHAAHKLYRAAGFSEKAAADAFSDLQPFEVSMALALSSEH